MRQIISAIYSLISRTHGPLIHERAISKVARHVEDAVSRGAQVLVGGKRVDGAGTFFAPTVLSEVPAGALSNFEETFGPVAGIVRHSVQSKRALADKTSYLLPSTP